MKRGVWSVSSGLGIATGIVWWLIIAWLVGDLIGVFLAGFTLVLLTAVSHAVLKRKKGTKYMLTDIGTSVYATTVAILAVLVLFALLPYVIPKSVTMNIYVFTLMILGPLMYIYFFIIYDLHHRFVEHDEKLWKSALNVLIKTAVVVVVLLILCTVGMRFAMNKAGEQLRYSEETHLEEARPPVYNGDLEVTQEIIALWRSEYDTYAAQEKYEADCIICSLDPAIDHMETTVYSVVQMGIAENIYETLKEYDDAEFPPGVAAELEKVKKRVEAQADRFVVEPFVLSKDYEQKFRVAMEELDYEDASVPSLLPHMSIENPVQWAAIYLALRTDDVQAVLDSHQRIGYILETEGDSPTLIRNMYENRNRNESVESKYVRYMILDGFLNREADQE